MGKKKTNRNNFGYLGRDFQVRLLAHLLTDHNFANSILDIITPTYFDDEYFKLGYAYHIQHNLKQAEINYKKSLAINNQFISAHKNLAMLYESIGQHQEALKHWQIVLNLAEQRKDDQYIKEAQKYLKHLQQTLKK